MNTQKRAPLREAVAREEDIAQRGSRTWSRQSRSLQARVARGTAGCSKKHTEELTPHVKNIGDEVQ